MIEKVKIDEEEFEIDTEDMFKAVLFDWYMMENEKLSKKEIAVRLALVLYFQKLFNLEE